MAVTCGFFNALDHDRLYDAIQMSSIFDGIIRDGIFSTIGTSMVVTAPENGMIVNVGAGRAWFNHTWILNDTLYPVEADPAEVVLDRIDAVVIEVNSSAEVRDCSIKFIKGEPSSQPNRPTMTHNAEVNQYALAYVRIRAGQTTIFQADITNAVGTDETPFITGILQQISAEQLILEWEDEFNRHFSNWELVNEAAYTSWTTNMQNQYTAWMTAKIADYQAWYTAMQAEGQEDLAEFDAWFQAMKDQLSEDAAGHLQAEIDALSADAEKGSVLTITTPNVSLHGRTCTVYQGSSANGRTATFDENGVAEFPSIPWVGNVSISATDGSQTATSIINIPYFGRYSQEIAFWAATVNIETTSTEFYGETITVEKDGSLIGSLQFDNTGHATYTATSPGVYTFTVTYDGVDYDSTVNVINKTTYNTIIDAWTATLNMDSSMTPELYGRAVTIAKGGQTVGTTAFDNTGHATFKVHEPGTYTVTSTTAGGSEFTTQVVVTEETAYEVDLGTPNGATATPTDNIQVWLKCGSEYSYNYTTIAQVLQDTELFARLCGDSNACDYMARSTTWADNVAADATAMHIVGMFDYCSEKLLADATWCQEICNSTYFESVLNVKVPNMTSNTAPSGAASYSSDATASNAAWESFSYTGGANQSGCYSNGSYLRLEYMFVNPVKVKAFAFTIGGNINIWSNNIKLLGSKTGNANEWVDLSTVIDTGGYSRNVNYSFTTNNDEAYKYYALYIGSKGSSPYIGGLLKVQFYGRASEEEYVPLVPTMTSNTTPSGVASVTNENSANSAYKVFDGDDASGILSDNGSSTLPWEIKYVFSSPIVKPSKFNIRWKTVYNMSNVTNIKLQLQDSSDNWVDIKQYTGAYTGNAEVNDTVYKTGLNDTYKAIRLVILNIREDNSVNNPVYGFIPITIQAYAEATNFVTIHSAPNDTIYYLDGSTPINVAVTDANGKGTMDKSLFDQGDIVLYSTVAKNPSNLSNAYSKTVKITKYTKETYLMPIGAIYWYGWKQSAFSVIIDNTGESIPCTGAINYLTNYLNFVTNYRSGGGGFAHYKIPNILTGPYNTFKWHIKDCYSGYTIVTYWDGVEVGYPLGTSNFGETSNAPTNEVLHKSITPNTTITSEIKCSAWSPNNSYMNTYALWLE